MERVAAPISDKAGHVLILYEAPGGEAPNHIPDVLVVRMLRINYSGKLCDVQDIAMGVVPTSQLVR